MFTDLLQGETIGCIPQAGTDGVDGPCSPAAYSGASRPGGFLRKAAACSPRIRGKPAVSDDFKWSSPA